MSDETACHRKLYKKIQVSRSAAHARLQVARRLYARFASDPAGLPFGGPLPRHPPVTPHRSEETTESTPRLKRDGNSASHHSVCARPAAGTAAGTSDSKKPFSSRDPRSERPFPAAAMGVAKLLIAAVACLLALPGLAHGASGARSRRPAVPWQTPHRAHTRARLHALRRPDIGEHSGCRGPVSRGAGPWATRQPPAKRRAATPGGGLQHQGHS